MTADDDPSVGRDAMDAELRSIVNCKDHDVLDFKYIRMGNCIGPAAVIIVPADRLHRRELFQLPQNFRLPDIAGVENQITSAKELHGFGP